MTAPTTASFQRERNPYGKGVADGRNSQTYAAVRKGAGLHCVWARAGVGDNSVGDYRADGYQLVQPKDVEIMGRGQYFPHEKDFGVYIEFDKKADRVQTTNGMTLMWAPQALIDEIHAENRKLGESYRKKEERKIDDTADVSFGTEVTTELKKLGDL